MRRMILPFVILAGLVLAACQTTSSGGTTAGADAGPGRDNGYRGTHNYSKGP